MDDTRAGQRKGLRPNNFDLIRLAAALQVVLLHSVENLGMSRPGWMEPLVWLPGVPIFFVLSGFLVSLSYERSPDLRSYAANRLLRIFPALWVCFFLSVLSVACIRPDLLASASPRGLLTWTAAHLSLGQFYNPPFLRDYGVAALNGSLWTIPVELQFYAVVPVVYFGLGLHRKRSTWLIPLILACLAVNRGFAAWKVSSDSTVMKLFGVTFLPHVWYFLAGVFVQRNFGRLRSLFDGKALWWLTAHAACCASLAPLGWHVGGNLIGPLPSLTLIGLTFSLAYTWPTISDRLLRHNDISYGTYLYHMVIVNALLELHWPGHAWTVVTVFALTLTCAMLSWRLVERPALGLKRFFQRPAIKTFEMSTQPAGQHAISPKHQPVDVPRNPEETPAAA